MRILFVIPDLDCSGAAKQLTLLAPALPREHFEVRVCAIGSDGPFGAVLQKAGIGVEILGWRRWVELGALGRWRRLLADYKPDIVHAWRPGALRFLNPLSGCAPDRLAVGAPLAARWKRMPTLDRWLLRRAGLVVASSPGEAERCRQLGVSPETIALVPPAVYVPQPATATGETNRPARLICVGPLEPHKGYRDAVWTFDMLHLIDPTAELHIIGAGPEVANVRRFVSVIQGGGQVQLLEPQTDVQALLAQADVVWVPSREPAGSNVVLEAMALGRPVIATRVPGLTDLVVDGATGFLIPPGDKVSLARYTWQLLKDPELRRRLGEAGRRRALDHFGVAAAAGQLADAYHRCFQRT